MQGSVSRESASSPRCWILSFSFLRPLREQGPGGAPLFLVHYPQVGLCLRLESQSLHRQKPGLKLSQIEVWRLRLSQQEK